MKKSIIFLCVLLALILGLAACKNTKENDNLNEIDEIVPEEYISEVEKEENSEEKLSSDEAEVSSEVLPKEKDDLGTIVAPIYIYDEFIDINATLFPEQDIYVTARLLGDSRIIATSKEYSILYDYISREVIKRLDGEVFPLGTNHFYSSKELSETEYLITLYDEDCNVITEHSSNRSAFPVTDGIHLVYDQRQIEIYNTVTGETQTKKIADYYPGFTGGIWNYSFNGTTLFFSTTTNPLPEGRDYIGAYNILTDEFYIPDTPEKFGSAISEPFGENSAIYWQDGSAYGTDGSYFIIVDMDNKEVTTRDLGMTACRVNDSGDFIVGIYGELRDNPNYSYLKGINIYFADADTCTYEVVFDDMPVQAYGSSFTNISLADNAKHIAFLARIEEKGNEVPKMLIYIVE